MHWLPDATNESKGNGKGVSMSREVVCNDDVDMIGLVWHKQGHNN